MTRLPGDRAAPAPFDPIEAARAAARACEIIPATVEIEADGYPHVVMVTADDGERWPFLISDLRDRAWG